MNPFYNCYKQAPRNKLQKAKLLIYDLILRRIMRTGMTSLVVLITSSHLISAASVKGQPLDQVEINLQLNDESLLNAFQKIEKQTSFHFMYRKEDVKDIHNLNLPPDKRTVAKILDIILANTSLIYKQIDQRILVMVKNPQEITVRGRITDGNGEPLTGASIVIKGTSIGTISDINGNYSIDAPEEGILVFSFIGYNTEEIPVNSRTTINVTLKESIRSLNEIVVTAFGIRREAKSITYGSQSVSTNELTEARSLNLTNTLQGKVAGMTITTSGTGLGSGSRVVLRGNRSISGDSQPLYVVDGVPISGGIDNMSPDNIASINVLKGPNAAALYGSAAQNGAIIIETKRGEEGVVNVSLNNTFMIGTPIHNLEVQNEYGQGVSGVYNGTLEESWGPKMEGQMVEHWSRDPALAGTTYAFTRQPDNYKKIFQTAYTMSSNLNATVGSKNTQTAFSYTREDARGMMQNNSLGRHDASVRVTSQLAKWLTLDSKINYIQQALDNPNSTGDDAFFNPYRNIYRMPRSVHHQDLAQYEYKDVNGLIRQNFWNPGSTSGKNPYWIMNHLLTLQDQKRVIALASLTFDFTENLNLMVRTSYDGGRSAQERKVSADTYGSTYDFGYYGVTKSGSEQWNNDLLLSYKDDITKDLNLTALLGGSIRTTGGEGTLSTSTTQQLIIRNFFSLGNTQIAAASFTPSDQTETQSLYFSGNIGWKNLIYMDVTGRNDWSSTLPADSRSYFYPSVGVSSILSDLIPALPDVFTFAKVRASWARVGNSAPAYMLSRAVAFGAGGNNGFLTLGGILPNENLKPERTESIEVGLDLRLFEGLLGLNFTAYKTNTYDQLFTISLPTGSGAASFFTNGGDVENKGVEVILTTTPVQTSNFMWDVSANFAVNRNWVNKISDERPRLIIGGDSYMRDFVVEQGREFGDMYSRGWQRDEQGRVIVGANGVPLITSGRTVMVANFNPDWAGAISNTFSYKNFSASFLIEHRQGGTVVSSTDAVLYGEGVTKETLAGRDGGLVFGQNLFAHETAVMADGTPNDVSVSAQDFWRTVGGRNTPVGEAFIRDATNTRLREVTIGYKLPQAMLAKLPFSNVKFSLVGRNLLFFQRSGNWDPEILTATNSIAEGFQSYVPPTERNIGVNLKINF